MKIPIAKPFFDEEEQKGLAGPLASGWVVQGPKVKAFEEEICAYTGARFAWATTSCTTALHLALLACGVGPGDEVIVPSFTFVASANAVEYVGARPVFVEIALDTFNMNIAMLESAITDRTKAIMPVHLFGLCADMDAVIELAERRGLKVVEDAACAIGAYYRGRHAGTFGDAGCFSFHPRKSITTGEGGMVVTNGPEIARRVEILRDHGAEISDLARHEGKGLLLPEYNLLGFNYRMTDIQGALGVTQMKKLPWILKRKRQLANRYDQELSRLKWLRTPVVPEGYTHGLQAYVCLFGGFGEALRPEHLPRLRAARDKLMIRMSEMGISTRQGTHAVHALGYYRKKYALGDWSFPNAWIAENLTLALPLYPTMTDQEQAFVIDALQKSAPLD